MSNRSYRIAVVPGDGTGPEVVAEGLKALKAAAKKEDLSLSFAEFDLGGERYKRTGDILPDEVLADLGGYDAIYLGAIGHPDVKPGILEKGILLALRFHFDQYVNLRPIKLYEGVETPLKGKGPADIDFVVVRENTEGLYAGAGGILKKGTPDEVAVQESINTRKGVERCVRYAFEYCRRRNRRKTLTLCGKTNVLTYAFDLWERVFREVAEEYPDIRTDYATWTPSACGWSRTRNGST
jgi:3-isopropylmalate dehydrogenase